MPARIPPRTGEAARYLQLSLGIPSLSRSSSVLAHHPDDHALHLDAIRIDHDRLHRRIGGLEPDLAILAVELLEGHIEPTHERDHHLAVVHRLAIFHDDEIAVADLLVDHRIALDAQHVAVTLADQALGHGNRFVAGDRLDGGAGGDEPEQRQFKGAAAHPRGHDLHRPAAIPRATDESFFLKVR